MAEKQLSKTDKTQMIESFHQRLLGDYGYQEEQIGMNVEISQDFSVDLAIWKNEDDKKNNRLPDICVTILCKMEHIKIDKKDVQGVFLSLRNNSLRFVVVHNLKETKVFLSDDKKTGSLEQIADFPKAADVGDDAMLNSFVTKMRNSSKEALIQAFGKCHNYIRNIDKLSPEAAFDEFSKVIVIKMDYERNPNGELIFTKQKFEQLENEYLEKKNKGEFLDVLFSKTKEFFHKDGLFEITDSIHIKRDTVLKIVETLEPFNLCSLSEDIRGLAFESFLGKTFRGELGQFFTPRTIVNYMVDVLDIKEGETICDPCCGSGGFLIRAFEHIQDLIDNDIHHRIHNVVNDIIMSESEKKRQIEQLLLELDKSHVGSRYYNLCHNYIYGVDANIRMARTSKMNMIMHGDGHLGVYCHDGLFNVGGVENGKFDVILINPPFGLRIARDLDNDGKKVNDIYQIKKSNAEALFIERCLMLLKPGGRAGLVLPDGILNNPNMEEVRIFVEREADILNITSIPSDVFIASGANVKPSLVFLRKKMKKREGHNKDIISISKVDDAGINSKGLPSDNRQLMELAPVVKEWISHKKAKSSLYFKTIYRNLMDKWNVNSCFDMQNVVLTSKYPSVLLKDLLSINNEKVDVLDDITYTRLTVKLFNKGIQKRDMLKGDLIGTKKQTKVRTGQFVVSKIDGKSGAFGFVPADLDGSIVTQDFMVFDLDETRVNPAYLELALNNDAILDQYKSASNGSTGRKRLSQAVFLSTRIPLPSIEEQKELVEEIVSMRNKIKELSEKIESQKINLSNILYKE